MKNLFKFILFFTMFLIYGFNSIAAEKSHKLLEPSWSFKGFFGKFDRAQLQRGYQVYTEVCSACHSVKYLSYRNLSQPGGPEFSEQQAKIIASQFEVIDGPNSDGEMFTRPARLSDKFVGSYANEQAATAANGGAYPPDMSVLVKARQGGADYIYSVLMGYEDPPSGITLVDGGWLEVVNYPNWIRFWSSIPEELRLYSFRFWLGFFHHQNIPRDHLLSHL